MPTVFSELEPLFANLRVDSLIVTPNKRLSRFLAEQFGAYQQGQGKTTWSSLRCMSVNTWWQNHWEQQRFSSAQPLPLLLTPSQEQMLWLESLRDHDQDLLLFNLGATAQACRKAWATWQQWRRGRDSEGQLSAVFRHWLDAYRQKCEQLEVIDFPSMVNEVLANSEAHPQTLPGHLICYAFDEIDPQLAHLLDLTTQQGHQVEHFSVELSSTKVMRTAMDSVDEEIQAAAQWAARCVEKHPKWRIGVVIPKLLSERQKVERIFNDVFEPQYVLPGQERHATAFNISAGVSLSKTAPIKAAMLALTLNRREMDVESVSTFLHSPFIGTVEELPWRAWADLQLRENYTRLSQSALRTALGELAANQKALNEETASASDLYTRLQRLHQYQIKTDTMLRPSQWGAVFSEQLRLLGWPGNRPLDTLEYQQVEVWVQTLGELSHFDFVFSTINFSQAFECLERLIFDAQFQAQTSNSPVQILGVFEAAGLVFDALWVMNLDNEVWPAATSPSALLPLALQKSLRMPKACAERELELAQQLTTRFQHSAQNVVFSHCTRDGDKQLRASPLIEAYTWVAPAAITQLQMHRHWQEIYAQGGVESFVDSCGPSIAKPKLIRGGTQILKDQGACAFRAFAKHRLQARKPDHAQEGMTAAERGNLIHRSLELVWKKLRSQQHLLALDDTQLTDILRQSIDKSFSGVKTKKIIGPRLKSLETERLLHLLLAWMVLEKKRAPFHVIFSETKKQIQLAKLPIHIRYDRIDKLEDGSLFVIDYKTGKLEVRAWAGPRPDEPQVPIYGVANHQTVSGVAFGQLNVDQVAFKGISDNADTVPGMPTPEELARLDLPDNWPDILQHWRQVLEGLAKEFIAGTADVKPKYGALSCRYCDLHSLCRIKEFIEDEDADAELEETSGENE